MKVIWGLAAMLTLASCEVKFDWPWLKDAKPSGKTVTEDRTVGAFDSVSLEGIGDLTFDTAVPAGVLRVTADQAALSGLKSEVDEGRLELKSDDFGLGSWKVEYRVAPPAALKSLSLGGMGSLTAETPLAGDELSIELSGMGQVHVVVAARKVSVEQSGMGELVLSGTAEEVSVDASGLGKVNTSELLAARTEVSSSGLGEVEVYASDFLKVDASGAGEVRYKGSPKTKDVQSSGATKVEPLN